MLQELQAENARLRAQIEILTGQLAAMNDRLAELLAIAKRKKSPPPKSAKPPAAPLNLDSAARATFDERPLAPALAPKPEKVAKPRKPTGRKALPEHLAAVEHVVTPSACECCGGTALDIIDEVIETKLDVIKEHQRKRIVRRKTARCRKCGERTTAMSLPAPFLRSKVTCDWLAWLVSMKFVLQVPLDRIRRDLASRKIPLAMSFLVSQIERAADLLSPIDGLHWKQLLAGSWMATDATGLKVLIPGLPGSHHGHIEVYRRPELVVFQYEPDKGAEALVSKLGPFKGLLVADAEHRHNPLYESGVIIEAGCNAHGRRKLRDAEAVQPLLAKEGGAFIANIYVAEAKAHEDGLTGAALKQWRGDKMLPLKQAFALWIDAVEPTLVPSDPLAATLRYYRNHWHALFRFIDEPDIPIDNSASEREFQAVAKLRLNSLFAGGTEGAHRAAVLLGIAATCRSIGINSLTYMAWAFERLGTHREHFALELADLTPAAFKRLQTTT